MLPSSWAGRSKLQVGMQGQQEFATVLVRSILCFFGRCVCVVPCIHPTLALHVRARGPGKTKLCPFPLSPCSPERLHFLLQLLLKWQTATPHPKVAATTCFLKNTRLETVQVIFKDCLETFSFLFYSLS